tara:strand:+ start:3628 stop:4560 length:933 start_codon:yes stop_codon:yes gene_type:complete
MGVKLLSKFLKNECYEDTEKIHLSCLYGKKICIDTSIYLYRFKGQGMLIENFYVMCSLFKKYNITPIFIFDGKPPIEKYKALENRKKERESAKEKYEDLMSKLEGNITQKQKYELDKLKRSMVKITKEDVYLIKSMFDAYGISHITAIGEADVLCASLVIKKKVYAVLTEDMDLFAYGSPIILRYFSLSQHSCILYNLNIILDKLNINKKDFQIICVLSGNDYYESKKNIYYYLKIYSKYKKTNSKKKLLNWLIEHNYIEIEDVIDIETTLNIYLNINKELKKYKYFQIKFHSTSKKSLMEILEKERFIF